MDAPPMQLGTVAQRHQSWEHDQVWSVCTQVQKEASPWAGFINRSNGTHLAADTCIRLHDHDPMPSPPRPLLTRGQPSKRVPGGNSLSSIAVLPGFLHQRPPVLAAWFCQPFSPPLMRPKFLSLLFDVCFFLSSATPICKKAPLPQATAFYTKTTTPQPAEKRRVDRSRPVPSSPQVCPHRQRANMRLLGT